MKPFAERNRLIIGAVGIVLSLVVMLGALNYQRLPLLNTAKTYTAYFAEAGGLSTLSKVQVAGFQAGEVSDIALDGPRVLVKFKVTKDIRLGDRTEAAIKLGTVLGSKILEITPRGDGQLTSTIPIDRTTSAYELPDALGDLSNTISGLDTDQVSNSLATLSQTFANTAPDLRAAVAGVGRFSQTLNERDEELRTLLTNAKRATGVLAQRSAKVVDLVVNTNSLLAELRTQSDALDQISGNLAALATQVKGLIEENREPLKPALEKLNGLLAIVDGRKREVQDAVKGLNKYALSLGESVSSGPFFAAYLVNLLPGQFAQPFIDAAFKDLGLDPATLSPTERIDPPTGQPGTPPLPVPLPRTGQGGEPRLTIPDAITGNPTDQTCGPPGIPMPGPGCYPARQTLPAPPPGGPPPGPPAQQLPGFENTPPGPQPPLNPLPGEVGSPQQPAGSSGPAPVQISPSEEPSTPSEGPQQ